jgi:hypothetical protein
VLIRKVRGGEAKAGDLTLARQERRPEPERSGRVGAEPHPDFRSKSRDVRSRSADALVPGLYHGDSRACRSTETGAREWMLVTVHARDPLSSDSLRVYGARHASVLIEPAQSMARFELAQPEPIRSG